MNLEVSIKKIKETYYVISGKDSEINIRYIGYSAGISKPWLVVVDSYTTKGETWELAVESMLNNLKLDLKAKIKMGETQIKAYQKILNHISLD